MKLERLELSGFKSFADYTEFLFDDGITAIVGPNGCGKSNVVDAVKWVLGEMSAKSLRGDAMLDVIFNGSGTRKPMGMAEVSLTFTNDDSGNGRRLPVDADHVKITRRLYRDATSEYLINNQTSRLKDIRELFLDTGVGVDAYSLIEQGRVASFLDANSVDRREIFEEAAGISRFKQRKKEAQRKLEKTDQNLAQSQLVVEEVEKQLRSVKMQAGRARNYQEYATRLKELRSQYVMREYDGLHQKRVALSDQLDAVIDELASLRRELDEKRTRQSELQMELESAQEAARKSERELLSAQSEQSSLRQRSDFARSQIQQFTEQRELLAAREKDLADRLERQRTDVSRHEAALAEVDQKLREHEAEVAEAALAQEQAAKAIAGLNRTLDEQKSKAIDLMRQLARLHNDINGLTINQENLGNQKARLETRRAEIEKQIAELRTRAAELDDRKGLLTSEITRMQEQATTIRDEQQANSRELAGLSQELSGKREHRSALVSRRNVLNDLQNKREGVSEAVRGILQAREKGQGFDYVRGLLSDIVSADLEHAGVIEAALGDLQNALIVTDSAALAADRDRWAKLAGRVTVIAADRMIACQPAEKIEGAAPLIDLITAPAADALLVHQLLGRTFITETLHTALELAETSGRDFRYVTRAGEVVESAAVPTVVMGDMSKRGGMISRRAEVARLAWELEELEADIARLSERMSHCDKKNREMDAQQQDLRQKIFAAESERAEKSAQAQQVASQLQRATAEAPLLAGEIESLATQIESAARRKADLETQAKTLEETQKQVEGQVRQLSAELLVRQHEMAERAEAVTRARVAMGQVQEQRSGISRELATARSAVNQAQMELQRVKGEAEGVAARIADAELTITQAQEKLVGWEEKISASQADFAAHQSRAGAFKEEAGVLAGSVERMQGQIDTEGRREHELSLAKNELSVRIETLIEHTMEELQINLHEAYAANPPAEMADADWENLSNEINELKGKISRLGNVNLDAITEQSTLEERLATLQGQLADIFNAKQQLEELIGKINEDSRQRFAESFEAVRAEFHDMFRRLFGGGKADLIMENPDDLLESGIEIVARPPGKEPQSMSLLSGGEKTMTAVALVMSIFKSKPSPFCILDEVDAALDEANTQRFAGIIQDFLAHSQFIVITHNKRTMSVATTLYGVTMQEQGISKRVAVKFDGQAAANVPARTTESAAA